MGTCDVLCVQQQHYVRVFFVAYWLSLEPVLNDTQVLLVYAFLTSHHDDSRIIQRDPVLSTPSAEIGAFFLFHKISPKEGKK